MLRLRVKTVSDGHAASLGINVGDYLIDYNGIEMVSSDALSNAMKRYAGTTNVMQVIRGQELHDFDVYAGSLGIVVEPMELDPKPLLDALIERSSKRVQIMQDAKTDDFQLPDLLTAFIGQKIGINLTDPAKMNGARLVRSCKDHFVVEYEGKEVYIPNSQIIRVIRSTNGLVSSGVFSSDYPLIIKVFDFVIYKGAVGVGASIPIG